MKHNFNILLLLGLIVCFLSAGTAVAGTVTWTGSSSADWMVSGNWNPSVAPGSDDDFVIDSSPANKCRNTTIFFAGKSLKISSGGTLEINADSSVTNTGGLIFDGGTNTFVNAANKALKCTNNVITVNNVNGAVGTMIVNDKASTVIYSLYGTLSGNGTITKVGTGKVIFFTASPLFNGAVRVDNGLVGVRDYTDGANAILSNATVRVTGGGCFEGYGSVTYVKDLQMNGGSIGVASGAGNPRTITANTISFLARSSITNLSTTKTLILTLNGVATGSSNLVLRRAAYPVSLKLGATFDGSGYDGAIEFELGTTNSLAGNNATLGGLVSASGAGLMWNDTAGTKTLTLEPPSGVTNDYSGVLTNGAGVLALTLNGSGVQKLSGANGYTGLTTVASGTLLVNGTLLAAGYGVGVNAGGTLGGTGTINRVVTNYAGGVLSPGDNGIGTLTVSNLTLTANSTNLFELGSGPVNDRVMVNGALTLGGELRVVARGDFVPLPGTAFLVMTNTATLTGAATDFDNDFDVNGTPYVKVWSNDLSTAIGKIGIYVVGGTAGSVTLSNYVADTVAGITNRPVSVVAGVATLSGDVVSNGLNSTAVYLYWGSSNEEQTKGSWANRDLLVTNTTAVGAISTNLVGLPAGTYFMTYMASNRVGESWASPSSMVFTITGGASQPVIQNDAATGVGAYSATANGTLSLTNGAATTVFLRWCTNSVQTQLDNETNLDVRAQGPVNFTLTGLTPETLYYYTFYATNSEGQGWPATTNSLTTTNAAPRITNGGVSNLLSTSATLCATLASTGAWDTVVYAYYGISNGVLNLVPGFQTWPQGFVSNNVSGLTRYTAYAYTFMASNQAGERWSGTTNFFVTPADLPTVNPAVSTGAVSASTAVLTMNVTGTGGAPTTVYSYWGTSSALGGAVSNLGVRSVESVSYTRTGLATNSLYYYAFMASNVAGRVWTETNTFRTLATPPAIANTGASNVTFTTATLCGNLTVTGGVETTVFCYWGLNSAQPTFDLGSSSMGIRAQGLVTNAVTGLSTGTVYAFTFMASNSMGVVWAATNTFSTTMDRPTISLTGVSNLWTNAATLCANVTTGLYPTTVFCCWGTNTANFTSLDIGQWPQGSVTNVVSGLTADTVYYWTYRATNAAGDVWAPTTNTFTTYPPNGDVYWDGGATVNSWTNPVNWSDDLPIDSAKNYVISVNTRTCAISAASTTFIGNSLTVYRGGVFDANEAGTINGAGTGQNGALILSGGQVRQSSSSQNKKLTVDNGIYVDTGPTIFDIAGTYDLTLSGALSGSGLLTKTGARRLAFEAASPDFTGIVNIDAGTMELRNAQSLTNATVYVNDSGTQAVYVSSSVSNLCLNGGTVNWSADVGATLSGSATVLKRSYLYKVKDITASLACKLTGNSNLVLRTEGALSYIRVASGFDGSGYDGAFEFESGAQLDLYDQNATLGGLVSVSGYGNIYNAMIGVKTLTLQPPAGVTNDYSGVLTNQTGAIALTLNGFGVQKLSGVNNSYSGATIVSNGTLVVNGVLLATANGLRVNAGGTLSGTGTINRVVTNYAGSVFSPGDNGIGTLTVSNLTLAANSTNLFELGSGPVNDRVMVNGVLTLGGELRVVARGDYVPLPGTAFLVMTNTATLTGAATAFDNSFPEGSDKKVFVYSNDLSTIIGKIGVYVANGSGTGGSVILSNYTEGATSLPAIANVNVSSTNSTGATLVGNLTATGMVETTVFCSWGVSNATPVLDIGTSNLGIRSQGYVTNVVLGLTPYTAYAYAFMASNSVGVSWAATNFFRTPANLPEVNPVVSTGTVTASSAELQMTLTSTGGAPTTVYSYLGTIESALTTVSNLGVRSAESVIYTRTGLFTNTVYYYAFMASNAAGKVWTTTNSFRTLDVIPKVAMAAAANPVMTGGTTAELTVLGSDDKGEALLSYTWQTNGTVPAAVTFVPNTSNPAKTSTVTFAKSGVYGFEVAIRDGDGFSITSSVVSVTVTQTLTTVVLTPSPVTVPLSSNRQFAVAFNDQFGLAMFPGLTNWAVLGDIGTIDGAGFFTATNVGSGYVTANGGGLTGTASVAVVEAVWTIAASAGAHGAISPSGDVLVANGSNAAFAITAAANYSIGDVLVDTVSQGPLSNDLTYTYTFTGVSSNRVIAATFTNRMPEVMSAATSTPMTVTSTSTVLSVVGADVEGESHLTYSWSTNGASPAAVTFSPNNVNAASNTTAAFTRAGIYGFRVVITDVPGLAVTSTVMVTVEQVPRVIGISPANATVVTNMTQSFTASATDQFARVMSSAPTFSWSVDSGANGSIDSAGLFTAGSTVGGPYVVKAISGTATGTASVTATDQKSSVTWTGTSGTDWMTAGNWSDNAVPSDVSDYVVTSSPPNKCTASGTVFGGNSLKLSVNGTLVNGNADRTISGSGGLILDGGKITYGATSVGYTLTATAGGITVNNVNGVVGTTIEHTGTVNFALAGVLSGSGVITKTGTGRLVGPESTTCPAFTGTVRIDDGTFSVRSENYASNATVRIDANGILQIFNDSETRVKELRLNGGLFGLDPSLGSLVTRTLTAQTIVMDARSFVATNKNTGCKLILNGAMTGNGNLVLMTGGNPAYLVIGPTFDGSGYDGAFEFQAGASINLAGNNTTLGGLVSTTGNGFVWNNTAGTKTLTLEPPLGVTNDYAGVLTNGAGVLALSLNGSGVQKLSGTINGYSGVTVISNGTLLVNGTLLATANGVTVHAGGTLGGTGTINRVVTNYAGGVLSPGDNGIGTLTVSNLSLEAGCTNVFDLGVDGDGDKVVVNGALSISNCVIRIEASDGVRPGVYDLFTYSTLPSGGASNVTIVPASYNQYLDFSQPGKVRMSFESGSIFRFR